jgi:uncharacterized protein involved in exopolysaccharide biosynthesis
MFAPEPKPRKPLRTRWTALALVFGMLIAVLAIDLLSILLALLTGQRERF